MGASPQEQSADDLRTACAESLGGQVGLRSFGSERHLLSWDMEESSGFIHTAQVSPGVAVHVARIDCAHPLDWEMEYQPTPFEFSLTRSPDSTTRTNRGDEVTQKGAGAYIAQCHEHGRMTCRWREAGVGEFACVTVTPERLKQLVGGNLPDPLLRMSVKRGGRLQVESSWGTHLESLLEEMIALDPHHTSTNLHLQAKSLEVLALMVDGLSCSTSNPPAQMSEFEIARLRRVRARLHAGLQDPPSLAELARDVGLSESKLKRDYREFFGKPVFTDLRERRLSEAHRMLQQGSCSVSEVAYRVGYQNPSKFAAAFRKMHGIAPSDLSRTISLG